MLAEPEVTGTGYRQEYLPGTDEAMAGVHGVAGRAGATVGRVDRDDLFCLQSRGLPRPEAERLLDRVLASGTAGARLVVE